MKWILILILAGVDGKPGVATHIPGFSHEECISAGYQAKKANANTTVICAAQADEIILNRNTKRKVAM